jgi:chemotaxis receptor (MCP) glutamine deamidase CheD
MNAPPHRPAPRQIPVAPDHFAVADDDVVFTAELASTVVLCLYDAVEEHGALLHLRFAARGQQSLEVTDRTLATDLLLLDRCVADLRQLTPRAQNLQGKIVAHVAAELTPQAVTEAVLKLVTDYLADAGVRIITTDVSARPARVRFRPSLGQVQREHPAMAVQGPSPR